MATSNSSNLSSPINLNLPIVPETDNPGLYTEASKIYTALRNLQAYVTGLQTNIETEFQNRTGYQAWPNDSGQWNTLTPAQTILAQNGWRLYVQAVVPLSFGQLVNLFDQGAGVLGARVASASSVLQRAAHGFVSTPAVISLGSFTEVQLGAGLCGAISGMSIGTKYYLSTSGSGTITPLKSTTTGEIVQYIGYAIASNRLIYDFLTEPIINP